MVALSPKHVENTVFSPAFLLSESIRYFADYSFGTSREKASTIFYDTAKEKRVYPHLRVNPCNLWSQHADLNRGPTDYESVALPAELCWRIDQWSIQGESIACPRFKVKPFFFWGNKRLGEGWRYPRRQGRRRAVKGDCDKRVTGV